MTYSSAPSPSHWHVNDPPQVLGNEDGERICMVGSEKLEGYLKFQINYKSFGLVCRSFLFFAEDKVTRC
jgi:hypothetical protein